jgi:hypothetical protein
MADARRIDVKGALAHTRENAGVIRGASGSAWVMITLVLSAIRTR